MSGLMGDWKCEPLEERGIYAVYCKGDVEALKERCDRLRREWREVVRENAKLHERLSRYEWQAKCREGEREAENMRQGG